MSNNTNPAEIYSGTTWELLPDNKFLKTGNTPLQLAGSNNISISKANLPAEKLQVEAHSMTRGTMEITGSFRGSGNASGVNGTGAFASSTNDGVNVHPGAEYRTFTAKLVASKSWTGSTSSASPYTSAMGNGTPLSINPEHITVKAWKRLS